MNGVAQDAGRDVEFAGGAIRASVSRSFSTGTGVLWVGEGFEVFVFGGGHAEGGFAHLGGEDGEVALLLDSALFPFIGEFVADGDAADALFDPLVGVAFLPVNLPHPLGGEFGVFDFFEAFVSDLREP